MTLLIIRGKILQKQRPGLTLFLMQLEKLLNQPVKAYLNQMENFFL